MLTERSRSRKTTYYRIPFIWNVYNRYIDRDRKEAGGHLGRG